MSKPILIAKNTIEFYLDPRMANRHGLIAGATGTGKTVTLQTIAEQLSLAGVPVFLVDVKGDLSGMSQTGVSNPKIEERLKLLGMTSQGFAACPVVYWDVFGKQGHPIRATISDMGPLLIGRLLNLNEVQTGVLTVIFKIADDQGLLLLDLKDLRAMVQYVGDNAASFTTNYGNISKASVGAIQRSLMELEAQGGGQFFGEPMLDILDLIQNNTKGLGVVNILSGQELIQSPKVYATFLLWLMAELFQQLPEVGDQEKPKFVFFFDEAHLLFEDAPDALLEKIEQVVRLIRSKGVGIYFITQNPTDIPAKVLAQLGNRVQHALRAFTPSDAKAIKAMAQTYRTNPKIDIEKAITELAVGEALISFLEEDGTPSMVDRGYILPPKSRIGTVSPQERQAVIASSVLNGTYEHAADRESAFELLKKRAQEQVSVPPQAAKPTVQRAQPKSETEKLIGAMATSAMRSVGSQIGRQIMRGVLGSIFKSR